MPKISWTAAALLAANTTRTNQGASLLIDKGSDAWFIERVRFQPLGTNVATVGRLFINNGEETINARSSVLIGEVTLPSTTASEVAALAAVEFTAGFYLPAGHRLYVAIGTAVAAGFAVAAIGGIDPNAPPTTNVAIGAFPRPGSLVAPV